MQLTPFINYSYFRGIKQQTRKCYSVELTNSNAETLKTCLKLQHGQKKIQDQKCQHIAGQSIKNFILCSPEIKADGAQHYLH